MANPALPVLFLVTCSCLPTLVLLCIGCFTPYWVVSDSTNELSGLFYNCGRNTSRCVVDTPDERKYFFIFYKIFIYCTL